MKIRDAKLDACAQDKLMWSNMRTELWPQTDDMHKAEIEEYYDGKSIDIEQVYFVDVEDKIVGFIELNIRNFAEGSRSGRVPYVEGWFIRKESRGRGYGKQLMRKAEAWAKDLGFNEIASDTEVDNQLSIELHKKLGYLETERVVCFLKDLS